MPALPPETSIGNQRFRLDEVIGRGGFGITYRALDREAAQFVAIKECFPFGCTRGEDGRVCPGDFASHETLDAFKRGFREQAKRLQTLRHPAIVAVHDCLDERNSSYLVMDWLEGPTLQGFIETRGPLFVDEALAIIERIAQALEAIHQAGWLHLDIKPENVILVKGAPVLVDFDLLSPRDQSTQHQTRPLALASQIGTPGYAPLEQYAQRASVSPATDVYALGATLYHLLSGGAPISAVDRAAGERLVPLHELPLDVPFHLSRAVEGAMELQSAKRIGSVAAFWEALQTPAEPEPSAGYARPRATHTRGFYRVVLKQKEHEVPNRCACCYASNPSSQWLLKSPSGKWNLPLCAMCERHQDAARSSGSVTFWGIGASLLLAFGGVGISVVSRSFFPIFLCLAALLVCFGAMSYGALKSSRAEEMQSNECCDVAEPATYLFNGRVHVWKFRNSEFAEEFLELNRAMVL